MKISEEEIDHIALLARLSLSDEEKEAFSTQLGDILRYMEKLNELNTTGVVPTSHVISLHNVLRDDLPQPSLSREDALSNAPSHTGMYYRVPKIIE